MSSSVKQSGLKCQFASDNTSGLCPEAWEAMKLANETYSSSYGDDPFTAQACDLFRKKFEIDCDVYFVLTGTAANSLSLASLCESYHSVIVHEKSHVETDECGAPEFFSNGTKILLAPGGDGKIQPDAIESIVTRRCDIHYPKPRVVSVSQCTELGTVYRLNELRSIEKTAAKHRLKFHMDGARFANALVFLKATPAELTWKCGVDVLCLGGIKLGASLAEAILFFNRDLSSEFAYRCKQAGQLAPKMKLYTAPWVAMLKDDQWIKNARHANKMATLLRSQLGELEGIELLYPTEANSVFVNLPGKAHQELIKSGWRFYTFIGTGGARFMCSWKTTEADVEELVRDIKAALK